jgi:hypothetical protein
MTPNDEDFRAAMREVVAQSGLSMRGLAAAMGRDPGYVASLLDPSRPSRARPTPADMEAASDATGISFVSLLESLWGIPASRLARELVSGSVGEANEPISQLSADERRLVADFAALLLTRRQRRPRRSEKGS